ncbi:FHA domain-containing protein [bacterium]|nr:FHA domain-containing protein [bacterium]
MVFLIFNPSYVQQESSTNMPMPGAAKNVFISAVLLGASFAAMLGGVLLVADELTSPPKRVIIKMATAAAIGALAGTIAGIIGQLAFSAMALTLPVLGVIIGRTIGWAVIGAGGGMGVGFAMGSWRRARMSMLGGLIGGAAGGFLFDMIASVTDGGSASRFIGFILMGAATGAAVALVEDIAKQNWVTVLSGPKEGKSFILTKPTTIIGRDELADIPLFGDPSLAKQHAYLLLQNNDVTVQSANGVSVGVNGSVTQSSQLRDGDLLTLGRFNLRFHQKAGAYTSSLKSTPQSQQRWFDNQPQSQSIPTYTAPQQTIVQPTATGSLSLTVIGGPHMDQQFRFGPGSIKIGREAGCDILLIQDTMVSRSHAEIIWDGTAWNIKDLGSKNGLWVGGRRVREHRLQIGDQIGVGQSILRVDSI